MTLPPTRYQNPLVCRDSICQNIEQRGFASCGAAGDQNIVAMLDSVGQHGSLFPGQHLAGNQVVHGEMP